MFFNFARFFPQMQAQLDTLLQDPQCSLETILDADNILQEIKGQGANKFAQHLIKNPDLYRNLISYVIESQEEFIDKKRQIQQEIQNEERYPFLCSEIMGAENALLIDFLFEPPETADSKTAEDVRSQLLPYFLSFLRSDTLCVTSAGYFSKGMLALIRRRGYSVWEHLTEDPTILSHIMKHLDSRHISEIVEKLIILDTTQEPPSEENFFDQRRALLDRIILLLQQKSHSYEIVDNISEILCEITSKSMNNIYYSSNEIIHFIEQIKNPELLFSVALKAQCPATYQVLINLVELMSKETNNKREEDEVVHNDQDHDFSLFEKIVRELPQALLAQDLNANNFQNSDRQQVSPFGLGRMRLLKLITTLIQINDETINEKFVQGRLFQALQVIYTLYPNNNQIHIYIDKILRLALDSNQPKFISNLIVDSNLLGFILAHHKVQNAKKAYIGILTQISNYVNEKAKSIPLIDQATRQNPEWGRYCNTILRDINTNEKNFLCNVNPRKGGDNFEEEDPAQDNVLEILKKFHPPYPKNPQHDQGDGNENGGDQNQQDHDEDEEIQEQLQEENQDLKEQPLEVEGGCAEGSPEIQREEDSEYNNNNYWKCEPRIDDKEMEEIVNNY